MYHNDGRMSLSDFCKMLIGHRH